MYDLTNKKALITGASGGIGLAIARRLHSQGAEVALSGTRENVLNELLNSLGSRAHVTVCDLRDSSSVGSLIENARESMGGLDILINNAGINRDALAVRMKDDDWNEVLNVNLTAAFRLSREALREMIKNRWGRIVSITSIVGEIGNSGQSNYAAAKAGLVGMTKSLALEVAARGVTVNCVSPGFIDTSMTKSLPSRIQEALFERIPMKTLGRPEDVASCVGFLSSEESAYITGQTFHVNGGMDMP